MLCKVRGSSKYHTRFTAPNGSRIRRSTGTEDRKLAQEYEDKLKETLWRAHRLGQVRHTWEESVVVYSLGKNVSSWHLGILDKHCRGKFLDELEGIRDTVVKERLDDKVCNSTVNRTLEVFRAVLKTAEKKGWCKPLYVEMLPEPPARVRWITRNEAADLLAELPEHLRKMVRFALATGLREENITGLEWSRVDLQRRVAWVEAVDAKTEVAYHVPLNDEAVEVIRECLGDHIRYVFTYEGWRRNKANGKWIQVYERTRVKKMNNHAWRKALTRTKTEDFRVHDLRHTWASWHVQNGTPLPVLQKLGGWRSVTMVMKYAHLGQSHVAEYAGNVFRAKELALDNKVLVAKDA